MSYAHRHGYELTQADQRSPGPVSPPHGVVPAETAYYCSGCGEYVDGETYEAPSGVTRVACERCGSEPPELQSREG